MTHDQFVLLVWEVRSLQKKWIETGNGQVRDKLRKKEFILDAELSKEVKPKYPQQMLFEAK
jgi:hypothetical protein